MHDLAVKTPRPAPKAAPAAQTQDADLAKATAWPLSPGGASSTRA